MSDPGSGRPSDERPPSSPLGSLGAALAGVLAPTQTVTLVVTTVVSIVMAAVLLPAVAEPLGSRLGFAGALLVIGALGWVIFVLATAALAILPPLMLPGRDRAVFAVHAWIGAREARRAFGRAARVIGLPTDARSADAWLARNPATDRNRLVRVDLLLFAGRFDDARAEADLLPERTPLEAYRKREELALVTDQAGGTVDEEALRAAVAAVPSGIDRTEAAVSLAVFRARRALPDGDWRAPLLEVRPAIPASDVRLLVVDFGLPIFETLFRRVVVPFTALLLVIAVSLTALSGPHP